MATKAETNAVCAAGRIQGIALVTFPAGSTIFTSPSEYGLSNTQYGSMFLPQVITDMAPDGSETVRERTVVQLPQHQ
jgi:hypothetical protein